MNKLTKHHAEKIQKLVAALKDSLSALESAADDALQDADEGDLEQFENFCSEVEAVSEAIENLDTDFV